MCMKNHVAYGLAILFLILSDLWLYHEYQESFGQVRTKEIEMRKLRSESHVANTSVTLLAQSMSASHQYENVHVENVEIEDEAKRTCRLKDALRKRIPKMVVFFSSQNCESCVSSMFSNLQAMCSDVKEEDLVVIGEFENRRAVNAYLRRRKIPFKVYYKSVQQPIGILGTEGSPFICMLASDLIAHDVVFPVKEVPLFTRLYIKTVKEKYEL